MSDQPRRDAVADAALDLGARVGRVIPMLTITDGGLRRNSPVVPEWPHGASRCPDMQSAEWLAATNVAVLLGAEDGAEEGLFVIDAMPGGSSGLVDGVTQIYYDASVPGAGGLHAISELEGTIGTLPPTLAVLKSNGTKGVHYFFRCKSPVPSRAGRADVVATIGWSRVFFRGERRWMTCPPRTHSTIWMPGCGPGEVEIAEAPAWLLELL